MSARLATDVAVENADRPRRPRAAVRTVPAVLGNVSGRGMSEPRVAQASKKCHGACPLMVRRIRSGDDRPAVAVRPCRSVPSSTTPSALRRFAASAFDYTTLIFRRSMGGGPSGRFWLPGQSCRGKRGPPATGRSKGRGPSHTRDAPPVHGPPSRRAPLEDRPAGVPRPGGPPDAPTRTRPRSGRPPPPLAASPPHCSRTPPQ